MQESVRALDSFQSALPSNSELRSATETFHIMLLRGYSIKLAGRQVTEQVKALSLYHRIPASLIPRFPKHATALEDFMTLKQFHDKYPVGFKLDGEPITDDVPLFPIHAHESLDRLVQEILLPLLLYKKHSSLVGSGLATPLSIGFIKEILPELEQACISENAISTPASASQNDETVELDKPVSQEEGEHLKQQFLSQQDALMDTMAEEFLSKNVVFLTWGVGDVKLLASINDQPMLADGASTLFLYNAATSITKDPPGYTSSYRMKSACDENQLNFAMEATSKLLTDAHAGVFISGRNALVYKEMRKLAGAMKPKLNVKELTYETDEDEFMAVVRAETTRVGTIDTKDPYLVLQKPSKVARTKKGVPRRFLPGNTAFKTSKVPIVKRETLIPIDFAEREAIFRSVIPSDKFTPGVKQSPAGSRGPSPDAAEEDSADDEEMKESETTSAMGPEKVPFSHGDAYKGQRPFLTYVVLYLACLHICSSTKHSYADICT